MNSFKPTIDRVDAAHRRGAAALTARDYTAAEAAFREELSLVPAHAEGRYRPAAIGLAQALMGLDRAEEAQAWLAAAAAPRLSPPPARAPAGGPPPQLKASRGHVLGQVRKIQPVQTPPSLWKPAGNLPRLLKFRVEGRDEAGRPLPPVPVEIRGMEIQGLVADGDWVEIPASWRPGDPPLKQVRNARNLEVIRGTGQAGHRLANVVLTVFLAGIVIMVVVGFVTLSNQRARSFPSGGMQMPPREPAASAPTLVLPGADGSGPSAGTPEPDTTRRPEAGPDKTDGTRPVAVPRPSAHRRGTSRGNR